jgi:hypothetical protein
VNIEKCKSLTVVEVVLTGFCSFLKRDKLYHDVAKPPLVLPQRQHIFTNCCEHFLIWNFTDDEGGCFGRAERIFSITKVPISDILSKMKFSLFKHGYETTARQSWKIWICDFQIKYFVNFSDFIIIFRFYWIIHHSSFTFTGMAVHRTLDYPGRCRYIIVKDILNFLILFGQQYSKESSTCHVWKEKAFQINQVGKGASLLLNGLWGINASESICTAKKK